MEPVSAPATTRDKTIPPLRHGESLSRDEFERRYHNMPNLSKAELIDGSVYMPSPLHILSHGSPHSMLVTWLGVYRAATPGLIVGDNATVRLSAVDEVQPDAVLFIASGGSACVSWDDYIEGPPELVVEIAASSSHYDALTKRARYQRAGVQEYLLWQTQDGQLDWWEQHAGTYVPINAGADNILRSNAFPGLWLSVPALLNDAPADMLAVLQQGLATEEHAALCRRLQNAL